MEASLRVLTVLRLGCVPLLVLSLGAAVSEELQTAASALPDLRFASCGWNCPFTHVSSLFSHKRLLKRAAVAFGCYF